MAWSHTISFHGLVLDCDEPRQRARQVRQGMTPSSIISYHSILWILIVESHSNPVAHVLNTAGIDLFNTIWYGMISFDIIPYSDSKPGRASLICHSPNTARYDPIKYHTIWSHIIPFYTQALYHSAVSSQMTWRRVRMPALLSLCAIARRVSSTASRLPGTISPRFALHGWQRLRRARSTCHVPNAVAYDS